MRRSLSSSLMAQRHRKGGDNGDRIQPCSSSCCRGTGATSQIKAYKYVDQGIILCCWPLYIYES